MAPQPLEDITRHSDMCVEYGEVARELAVKYTETARAYGEAAARDYYRAAAQAQRWWMAVDAGCTYRWRMPRAN